jgi:hypothetical protein
MLGVRLHQLHCLFVCLFLFGPSCHCDSILGYSYSRHLIYGKLFLYMTRSDRMLTSTAVKQYFTLTLEVFSHIEFCQRGNCGGERERQYFVQLASN